MASLSCLLALKRGTLAAAILIFSPVCGLRPSPALRLVTWNVPKPTSRTFSFFFNDLVITVSMASMAPAASVLERLVEAATAAIKSYLFTGEPLHGPAASSVRAAGKRRQRRIPYFVGWAASNSHKLRQQFPIRCHRSAGVPPTHDHERTGRPRTV